MSREKFEAWAKEREFDLSRFPVGLYAELFTRVCWDAWQAATAEQAEQLTIAKQRIAELEKDCEILQTNLDDALRAARYESDLCGQAIADMKKHEQEIERLNGAILIGSYLANVAFNFAQKRGYTLTGDDCQLFDDYRKKFDKALKGAE